MSRARTIRLSVRLWAEYTRQVRAGRRLRPATAAKWQERVDSLVLEHLALVDKIARQVWGRFTRAGQNGYTSHIDLADMVAYGRIGLVEAARRYNPEDGDFPKFAFRRVRGAMIDAHRRGAYRDMQHESLDAASDYVAEENSNRGRAYGASPHALYLVRQMEDRSPGPDEQLRSREVEKLAVRAIRQLNDDERVVLIDALRGRRLDDTAAEQGRSVAWARAKLASAREKVADQVRREQRVA